MSFSNLSWTLLFAGLLQQSFSFTAPWTATSPSRFGTAKASTGLYMDVAGGEEKKRSLVIWDCDGVLVDSEALLKQGEVESLATYGIDCKVDDCV